LCPELCPAGFLHAKAIEPWRRRNRRADGSWKIIRDIGNSDLPAGK